MHLPNKKKTISNHGSRNIMYQSRMCYLKSRDGHSGRRTPHGNKSSSSSSQSSSSLYSSSSGPFSFGASLKPIPCSAEKLLPPLQLMTRERSVRQLYWKYHPPATKIRKMDFLQRNEDPVVKKKREEIFARLRAAEISAERIRREKETRQKDRMAAINDSLSLPPAVSEYSTNEDSQDQDGSVSIVTNNTSNSTPSDAKSDVKSGHDTRKDSIPGLISDGKRSGTDIVPSSPCDDTNDDEEYGDSFSFLAEWKKERTTHGNKRKMIS